MGPKKGRLRSSPHIVGNGSGLKQPRGVRGRYMGAPFNHQLLLASASSGTCMSDKTKIFLNAHGFIAVLPIQNLPSMRIFWYWFNSYILNTILITVIVVIFIVIRNIIIFINIFIIVALLISKRSKFYGCVPRSAFWPRLIDHLFYLHQNSTIFI